MYLQSSLFTSPFLYVIFIYIFFPFVCLNCTRYIVTRALNKGTTPIYKSYSTSDDVSAHGAARGCATQEGQEGITLVYAAYNSYGYAEGRRGERGEREREGERGERGERGGMVHEKKKHEDRERERGREGDRK